MYFHKEPTRSGIFVRKAVWRQIEEVCPDILVVHARGASKGVGLPSDNENNHPFTSSDKSLALVHNGRIDDCEYSVLTRKYEVKTLCDSEVLIRIIEAAESDTKNRLKGISDIFRLINHGHMAVALSERISEHERCLWLFRNRHRPLWIVDLRDELGQVLFFSEPNIWQEALASCEEARDLLGSVKLIELPPEEIWELKIDRQNRSCQTVERYSVQRSGEKPWEYDGEVVSVKEQKRLFPLHTILDDNDSLDLEKYSEDNDLRIDILNSSCDTIIDVVNAIRQYAEVTTQERMMSKGEFEQLVAQLNDKVQELEEISSRIEKRAGVDR